MHHAYLISKDISEIKSFALEHLELNREETEFLIWEENNFKIEDARSVIDSLSGTSLEGKNRIVIISFLTMNGEAQNSLLKIVEEPAENIYFFFNTSSPERILPTLASRLLKIDSDKKDELKSNSKTSKSIKDNLKRAGKIVDGIKAEKMSKEDALNFMDELISTNRNSGDNSKLKKLLVLRGYILDQSSSVKQILESAVAISA